MEKDCIWVGGRQEKKTFLNSQKWDVYMKMDLSYSARTNIVT